MRTIHLAALLSLLLFSAHVPAAHAHEILSADLSTAQHINSARGRIEFAADARGD